MDNLFLWTSRAGKAIRDWEQLPGVCAFIKGTPEVVLGINWQEKRFKLLEISVLIGLCQVVPGWDHSAEISCQRYCSPELPHTCRGKCCPLSMLTQHALKRDGYEFDIPFADNGPGLPISNGKELPGVRGSAAVWSGPLGQQEQGGRAERRGTGVSLSGLWVWGKAVRREEDCWERDATLAHACESQQTGRKEENKDEEGSEKQRGGRGRQKIVLS